MLFATNLMLFIILALCALSQVTVRILHVFSTTLIYRFVRIHGRFDLLGV